MDYLAVYGSSKGDFLTKVNGYPEIKCDHDGLAPLIVEVCRRSQGRLVAEVTFNFQTISDLDGQRPPPAFVYLLFVTCSISPRAATG
eukprot:4362163-Pleurochrysis_carterae.AAC.2